MKKKFAFLEFHVHEDHKNMNSIEDDEFFKNPVMLKTDRFLEKELRDKMQLGQTRPYTLVVDTAGCNKNCWFCYAYPIVKKENYDRCRSILLSPEELTQCFENKLLSLKSKVLEKDRFFSKLRITGGEPLFSTEDTLEDSDGTNYPYETIVYFLKFFELLDSVIGKMVNIGSIFLTAPRAYSNDIPFPTFLCTDDNRVEVRFDTNGFLFSDRRFAEGFVGGIYKLLEQGKLNNLLIRIDYSLKGVHPLEVFWSQNQKLPVDESKLRDFKIEEHPQYQGLKNIFDLIEDFCKKNPAFRKCFDITVEPGINNVKGNYMYYEGRLDWTQLERKLQAKLGGSFKISDVDNKMEVRGKIHTHLKRGVAIKILFEGGDFMCLPTDPKSKKDELFSLIRKNKDKKLKKIYIPYIGGSE